MAGWPTAQAVRWVEHALGRGARVVSSRPLPGGITADMFWLSVAGTGVPDAVVLRCWPLESAWGPERVISEQAGLELLAATDLPAPRILAADSTGATAGRPSTLTTALTGSVALDPPDLEPWLGQLSDMLVRIHDLAPGELPAREDRSPAADLDLSWLGDQGLAREAVAACAQVPAGAQNTFCHGDYQHFNVLWADGRISAVVDWPNAGQANPGRDVGHCRLNLAVLYSVEAAERFRLLYESAAGTPVGPGADLRELLVFSAAWLEFIPLQVHGRAPLDIAGMPGRVRDLVALALSR